MPNKPCKFPHDNCGRIDAGARSGGKHMTGARIAVPLGLAVAFAIAALTIAPRAFEAQWLLAAH